MSNFGSTKAIGEEKLKKTRLNNLFDFYVCGGELCRDYIKENSKDLIRRRSSSSDPATGGKHQHKPRGIWMTYGPNEFEAMGPEYMDASLREVMDLASDTDDADFILLQSGETIRLESASGQVESIPTFYAHHEESADGSSTDHCSEGAQRTEPNWEILDPYLQKWSARGLPMLCANPDKKLAPARIMQGVIAARYEEEWKV